MQNVASVCVFCECYARNIELKEKKSDQRTREMHTQSEKRYKIRSCCVFIFYIHLFSIHMFDEQNAFGAMVALKKLSHDNANSPYSTLTHTRSHYHFIFNSTLYIYGLNASTTFDACNNNIKKREIFSIASSFQFFLFHQRSSCRNATMYSYCVYIIFIVCAFCLAKKA